MKTHLATLVAGALIGVLIGRATTPGLADTTQAISGPSRIEVGFSPAGEAEHLVLRTIAGARTKLRIAAYAFTSRAITEALIAARHNGVRVEIVADAHSNRDSPYARAAFGALLNAGAAIRLNDHYAIHHDKFIIADDDVVETGSFNYTFSAATRNSENALVISKNPAVVGQYATHWQSRYDEARPYELDAARR